MIVCAFEDRETDIIGLKLLICSVTRYLPGVPLRIFCPVATGDFCAWLVDYPQVALDRDQELMGKGWDVKPILLQRLLAEGHRTVLWLDSDIIVTADFRALFPADDKLVVAQEPALEPYGVRQRVQGWKFSLGRTLLGINTCVIRANASHQNLVGVWRELLQRPEYTAATTLPFELRQPHVLGDQDVLTALLCSDTYADVEVFILRSGQDIIQHCGCRGYSPLQRVRHLFVGMPPFIHSQCAKPWRFPTVPSLWTQPHDFFTCLYLELSPYAHFARQFRAQIPGFPQVLEIRTRLGKVSNMLSLGSPSLRGITQAVVATGWHALRRTVALPGRVWRRFYPARTNAGI